MSHPQDFDDNGSLKKIVPHIFRRPFISVHPSESLVHFAAFLAIGPQLYVDGIIVIDEKKPVGRIGSKHILKAIMGSHRLDWLTKKAVDLMDKSNGIEADEQLDAVLDVFRETRFAFLPVTLDGSLVAALSIRDLLPWMVSSVSGRVSSISSNVISIDVDSGIQDALNIMLDNDVRNLIVTDGNKRRVINDRKILEFLLSHKGREIIETSNISAGFSIKVRALDMLNPAGIDASMPMSDAAKLLMDIANPCLLLNSSDSIVTPWDIVMKGYSR